MRDEIQVSPCGDDFLCRRRRRGAERRLQHNHRRSFAWRLTVAPRRYAPKAPVRLHKATHWSHHPSLTTHHFSCHRQKKKNLVRYKPRGAGRTGAESTPLQKREVIVMKRIIVLMLLIDIFMMLLTAIIAVVK